MFFMIIIILNNGQLKKHRDICSEKQEVILTCLPTAFEMLKCTSTHKESFCETSLFRFINDYEIFAVI